MSDKKPSKLSTALANVKKDDAEAPRGGLKAVLTRKEGSSVQDAPQKTDLSAIHKAVVKSSATSTIVGEEVRRDKGICFVIDATASREHSWREAQSIQAKMFDAVQKTSPLQVGIICHRGSRVYPLGWFDDAATAKRRMAEIDCISGSTRIVPSFYEAMNGGGRKPPSAIILVGDTFEEDFSSLQQVCEQLKDKGVKVYAFLEGSDDNAQSAYAYAADTTGGVFRRFGQDLDLGLEDLCVAAAVQATGGQEAFDRLLKENHKGALALKGAVRGLLSNGSSSAPKK